MQNSNESVFIKISKGKLACIDSQDYEEITKYKWNAVKKGDHYYAVRAHKRNGIQKQVYMHKVICPVEPPLWVDHINRNTLDNRRSNLRPCTRSQNFMNRNQKKLNGSRPSKYKGVVWTGYKWNATVTKDRKKHSIGSFDTEEEAALVYNEMAKELFGEFALLNTVENEQSYIQGLTRKLRARGIKVLMVAARFSKRSLRMEFDNAVMEMEGEG